MIVSSAEIYSKFYIAMCVISLARMFMPGTGLSHIKMSLDVLTKGLPFFIISTF